MGSSSLCSLWDLLLTLSVPCSAGCKQIDCEPDTQPFWVLVLAFLARAEVLLVVGKKCCHQSVQTLLVCFSAEKNGSSKFQLPATAVRKRVRAQSQLDFIGKVSHLVSKNSRGKGETQLQAKRRRQRCFQDVNEVLAVCTNSVHLRCACTLLSPMNQFNLHLLLLYQLQEPQRTRILSEK